MYIIKNAVHNVVRNKGKNILLGIIALIIGLSSCLALSIREAAEKEKASGLEDLSITATIGMDRMSMMKGQKPEDGETLDRSDKKAMFSQMESLSLDELQVYAEAKSVKSFYYTETLTLNVSSIEAIEMSSSGDDDKKGQQMPDMSSQGDVRLIGYSDDDAMSSLSEAGASITSGEIFQESDTTSCIINEELAEYNDVSVGDFIAFVNVNNEAETYTLKILGIYTASESQADMGRGMAMMDAANQIYTSTAAVDAMVSQSATTNESDHDSSLTASVSGTYVFEDVEAYEAFESEAKALGLSDDYTVNSQDVTAYERSLQPLMNLSNYAMIFLAIVLVIGGVILIVLHLYHIKARKYEIGVLAAIGMNKKKIAGQFITEIFIVTMIAVFIGTGIGSISSVPLTNTLLNSVSQTDTEHGGFKPSEGNKEEENTNTNKKEGSSISVTSAFDIRVMLEVSGVCLLLVIFSGGVAVLSILRYEPLKILSNRE